MDILELIHKATDKSNLTRVRFEEKNIPTSPSNICIFIYFGDYRSLAVLSSILLKRYRDQIKGSKYFILCSWSGAEDLFPYIDEYWTVDNTTASKLALSVDNGANNSDVLVTIIRNLNYYFEDVNSYDDIKEFYQNGIKQDFWDTFKNFKRYLPSIPSFGILNSDLVRDLSKLNNKVAIYPSKNIYSYNNGKVETKKISSNFWNLLCKRLKNEGYNPVIIIDSFTYDLSKDLTDFIHFKFDNFIDMLVLMRYIGCVLDIFNGISRMAILARTPYIAVTERNLYNYFKDYEIDDLIARDLPRGYIYTFSNVVHTDSEKLLNLNIFDGIVAKLNRLIPEMAGITLPSTYEIDEIVPYSEVRKRKLKKIGSKFVKVKRD